MRKGSVLLGCAIGVLVVAISAVGDTNLAITAFDDGMLTWTNVDPNLYYNVQWRPSLTVTNDWTSSYRGCQDLRSTDPTITVPVPMFYRIAGTSNPANTRVMSPDSALIEAGYYEGTNLIQVDNDLVSGNIRAGTTIFGVAGDPNVVDTSSGDAAASDIKAGRRAWVDGTEVTGTIPTRTLSPTTEVVEAGYYDATTLTAVDADLCPSNIAAGTSVFGMEGTHGRYHSDAFPAPRWAAYDPGDNGVGAIAEGYAGAVFDGRYLYCVPFRDTLAYHGEVLRYDTQGAFDATNAWAAYNPQANGVGTDGIGYVGGVFDGRYVYFSPYSNGSAGQGEVLRYDTLGPFSDVASWAAYDTPVGSHSEGFYGAVFDGRHVYFVPHNNNAGRNGEVLRYDTQGSFASDASWTAYDAGDNGVGTDPECFMGGVFDGRYVYCVPYHNGTAYNAEVLRYDTQGSFTSAVSWAAYDAVANGVGDDARGFAGAVFDGRYVYFVPLVNDSGGHGEVLRLDTEGAFDSTNSWVVFDAGDHGIGKDPDGFRGAVFDGRFAYFVPDHNGTIRDGEILRYDTLRPFDDTDAWATLDPGDLGIASGKAGYFGGVFDGQYIYFVPCLDSDSGYHSHGEVLRLDAKSPPEIPSTVYGGSSF